MKTEQNARIYRHGNNLAFDSESMEQTIYFDHAMIKGLIESLIKLDEDITKTTFPKSNFSGIVLGHFGGK